MTQRRWLITGCSSGLGQALARRLASTGERVLATARDVTSLADLSSYGPNVVTAALDVRDPAQCVAVVALAVERFGGVDVLVNNAGYGQFGVVEEVSDDELAAQFDTNVYGPWRLLREVLPLWRAQGGGHAIFSSSLSGTMAFPGLAAYTASKFALEGLAESVAIETAHLGVKVTILQMGGFSTSYGQKLHIPAQRLPDYDPIVSGMLDSMLHLADNPDVSHPDLFADVVQRVAGMDNPPRRLPFGAGAFHLLDAVMKTRQEEYELARSADSQAPVG